MIFEKKWPDVPVRPFIASGASNGLITISSTKGFYVKQKIIVSAPLPLGEKQFQIKRIISETQMFVGEPSESINHRSDMSAYLLSLNPFVYAFVQDRPSIAHEDYERAVYAEEPIVAKRSVLVDELGRYWSVANPFPVRLSDGSINIGTVNAELEVQLSHQDNVPDPGDIHDSVRIGDGTDQLQINPDGSINTSVLLPSIYKIDELSMPLANTYYEYQFPSNTRYFTIKARNHSGIVRIYETGSSTKFFTIGIGATYSSTQIKTENLSIWAQGSKPNMTLEIMYWVYQT